MDNLKCILQIGSHIGNTPNDPIYNLVNENTKLILVEPVPYLFNELKKNYKSKNIKDITFINKAVSDSIKEIDLYIPSLKNNFNNFPYYASQLSSVNKDHIERHLKNLITEKIKVKTTTINNIIETYNIKNIDLLHTDTEGHDYNILMSYDFIIKPKYIMFEYKHIDGCFKVGEKLDILLNKLFLLNYKIINKDTEDITLKLNEADSLC